MTIVLMLAAAVAAPSAPATQRVLPAALALEAAGVALATCASQGSAVAVAVIDRNGVLRLLAADPDVNAISIELAQRKARAAAMFKSRSGEVGARFQANPAFAAAMTSVEPRLSGAQGAIPVTADGETLAAIGVSGAPGGDKDEACAAAGLAAVANRLR
jgi:uncharacterized protein GlcG (DUF336 family)